MQNSLEDIAISTYKNNLEYFEKKQPAIFSKLSAFESAVEQNLYELKYDLIMKENYFDVLELSSGNYLYDSNSYEYASLASSSINFQKDSNLFETFKKVIIKKNDLKKYEELSILENNLSGLAPIISYIQENMPNETTLKSIQKFIFFGTGLGTHIMSIDKKIHADVYLIVEDDLELFKLSLFTTPYFELATRANLIFSVFDSKEEFASPALEFLKTHFYHNHYIKYFEMLNQNGEKLKEFHLKIASQSHNLFYYNTILEQYLKPLDYLQDKFKFLNILEMQKSSLLKTKPVLLLGAGPSLGKNIEWIKKYQDSFIIVALSATMSILEKESITPDIITHIDGMEESIIHFTKVKSLSFFKESTFLISSRSPREIVDILDKENIFFFENGTSYKIEFGNLSAACVGSTTYLLLLALNIKDMYLLGLDLALDSKTGSTHSTGHEYTQQLNLKSSLLDEDTITFKESTLKVPGNLQDSVFTTPDFLNSINSINSASTGFKRADQNVYNLSDGAYFTNTTSKQSQNVVVKNFNKEKIRADIKSTFSKHSAITMTQKELKNIHDKYLRSLEVEKIIQLQESLTFNSSINFLDSLVKLFDSISRSSKQADYDLALIYQEYFKFIYSFIFDFFNSEGSIKNQNSSNQINNLLCKELLKIVTIYKNSIDLKTEDN